MAWWLPWKRATLSSAASVEEVQHRLAAATAEWTVTEWGTPVASPPWMGLHFVAVKGAVGLSAFPIVVTGTVLPAGANTQLEAMIRPHGSVLIGTAIFVILAAFNASQSGSVGRIILPVAALLAYMLLVGLSRERARPVEALLKEVCR